jgi:hypothetical protein
VAARPNLGLAPREVAISACPDAAAAARAAGYRPRPNNLIMSYSAKINHRERQQI